jgi:hypothetical protein
VSFLKEKKLVITSVIKKDISVINYSTDIRKRWTKLKCVLCNEDFPESQLEEHVIREHGGHISPYKYIFALQKKIEDLENKVQQHHG